MQANGIGYVDTMMEFYLHPPPHGCPMNNGQRNLSS